MSRKKNKTKKFTFNILDALIILTSLFLLAVCVYVFILGNDLSDLMAKGGALSFINTGLKFS